MSSAFLREEADNDDNDSWWRYLGYGPNAGDNHFRSVLHLFVDRRTENDGMGVTPNADEGVVPMDATTPYMDRRRRMFSERELLAPGVRDANIAGG